MKQHDDIELTENALRVLERRYLQKNADGVVIETPRELFRRVADFIAQADRNYGRDDRHVQQTAARFFDMMARLEFLPNSPTLMNAGRSLGQLSACFVLPVGDSMEQIFEANKHAALIHKSGGGTGFSFSRLRPRGSMVATTSGVASGPVSFMKVFDASTEAVKQGGTRRGANMGILRIDHPDILEFISCKDDTTQFTNFNISVAVTDSFMEALQKRTAYPLINPRTGQIHEIDGKQVRLEAAIVWEQIVDHSWRTGEPGVIFIDRMNQLNPTYPHETIEATNPCGEQPLPPYDSCNLGSINLGRFVNEPDSWTGEPVDAATALDWNRLAAVVHAAVHFLDNVIDQNRYPLPQIEEQTRKNRRIGLGLMGWADALVKLRLPYDSPDARSLASRVMSFVQTEASTASSELVKTRGRFPNWEKSVYKERSLAMRNATVTTIAPTGTISIIAGCSSGIEPYYALVYERNVMDGTRLLEVNHLFRHALHQLNLYSDELVRAVSTLPSIAALDSLPRELRQLFVTAADVSPEDHIRMQASFQEHCDSSVSKTINLPAGAARDDVRRALELAFETGCKGVTIYRDRSRPDQVLSAVLPSGVISPEGDGSPSPAEPVEPRPRVLSGLTEKIKTGYGNLYVTVNVRNGRPFEVFASIGKSGYTTMADTEAICRLISLSLRASIPVDQVIRQLRGIGGAAQVFSSGGRVFSIPDAIAQVLQRHFGSEGPAAEACPDSSTSGDICPECGEKLTFESGCYACHSCGYSTC